jgi:3-oxoacyl-[acyl-carrier-protein] synthase II
MPRRELEAVMSALSIVMDYAIANGFGFGGVNASALFRRWTDELTGGSAGGAHD